MLATAWDARCRADSPTSPTHVLVAALRQAQVVLDGHAAGPAGLLACNGGRQGTVFTSAQAGDDVGSPAAAMHLPPACTLTRRTCKLALGHQRGIHAGAPLLVAIPLQGAVWVAHRGQDEQGAA